MDIAAVIGALLAAVTLLLGLMKSMTGSVKNELSARDVEQEKLITKLRADLDETGRKVSDTRSEMHGDYAKRVDLEAVERGLRDDVNKVFEVVNAVSRDLNQMIGEFRALNQMNQMNQAQENRGGKNG